MLHANTSVKPGVFVKLCRPEDLTERPEMNEYGEYVFADIDFDPELMKHIDTERPYRVSDVDEDGDIKLGCFTWTWPRELVCEIQHIDA